MEYSIKSSELKNDMLVQTLEALCKAYKEIGAEVYVVGAAARDICLRLLKSADSPRRTMDLDVAVLLGKWEEYEQLSEILVHQGFEKAPQKQRFYYRPTGYAYPYGVDIVPFGPIAVDEAIAWPPEGSPVMSVNCYEDVMGASDLVVIDNQTSFRLASLSGQWLIKLDAWRDRHLSTRKDASDLVYFLENAYILFALSRESIPESINTDADSFDLTVAGAEWIASDLAAILSPEHREYYAELLGTEATKATDSPLVNDLYGNSTTSSFDSIIRALRRISEVIVQEQ